MRLRRPGRRTTFFLSMLWLAVPALLPLRVGLSLLGLERSGLSARGADGTMWYGALEGAQLGPAALGDVSTRLQTLPLLLGRARFDLRRAGGGAPLSLGVSATAHGFGVEDATGNFPLSPIAPGLPLAAIDLDDLTVRFSGGRCDHAEGAVKAGFSGNLAGVPLSNGMSGTAECEDGALLLRLGGASGLDTLSLRLSGDGRYDGLLGVRTSDPTQTDKLRSYGFTPFRGTWTMKFSGRF